MGNFKFEISKGEAMRRQAVAARDAVSVEYAK
jgi:hypothetical protein